MSQATGMNVANNISMGGLATLLKGTLPAGALAGTFWINSQGGQVIGVPNVIITFSGYDSSSYAPRGATIVHEILHLVAGGSGPTSNAPANMSHTNVARLLGLEPGATDATASDRINNWLASGCK